MRERHVSWVNNISHSNLSHLPVFKQLSGGRVGLSIREVSSQVQVLNLKSQRVIFKLTIKIMDSPTTIILRTLISFGPSVFLKCVPHIHISTWHYTVAVPGNFYTDCIRFFPFKILASQDREPSAMKRQSSHRP